MAYITLIERQSEKKFLIVDRILVNQNFLNCFDIDFGSTAFFTYYDSYPKEPFVKDLIKWIEDKLKWEAKQQQKFYHKYETEPRKFAAEKFLPKIKKWKRDMRVDYF